MSEIKVLTKMIKNLQSEMANQVLTIAMNDTSIIQIDDG